MTVDGQTARRALRATLLAWAGVAAGARADVTAIVEPSYSHTTVETRDASGVSEFTSSNFQQRYRLGLSQQLFPLLKADAGGTYDWTLGTTGTRGDSVDTDARLWSAFGRLAFGNPTLAGVLSYDRRQVVTSLTTGGARLRAPEVVHESFGATGTWNPAELPALAIRLTRSHDYDRRGATLDTTTTDALASLTYRPAPPLDLGYTIQFTNPEDRLNGVETRNTSQNARVAWTDRLLDGRLTAYTMVSADNRQSETTARGAGGSVTTRRSPTAAYSLVEAFPATPERDTLSPNPALVDGDLALGAGLDIGFGPTAAGDVAYRDAGAQFANVIEPVNTIYLYVDRPVPGEVAAAFTWTAYRSDDNVVWTPVALAGPVRFGLFQNRFEIPIARTEARFVKVVTRPLLTAVTNDPQLARIVITELETLLVVPAPEARGKSSRTSAQATATARYVILRNPNLSYDFAGFLSRSDNPARTAWNVLNGLSMSKRLTRILGFSGRVDRSDSDAGTGHQGASRLSVGLAADPYPTLRGTATYNAQLVEGQRGNALTNGVSLAGQMDAYTGVSLGTNVAYFFGRNEEAQATESTSASFAATLVPNRVATVTGALTYARSAARGGSAADVTTEEGRVEGTLTLSPFQALYLSAGLSRYIVGRAATLANVALNASPFPRGNLLMRFSYNETLDTTSDLRTRLWGPGLRWNVRHGMYLDASYTVNDSLGAVVETRARTFFVDLVIALR